VAGQQRGAASQPAASEHGLEGEVDRAARKLDVDDQPRPSINQPSSARSSGTDPGQPTMHAIVLAGAERGLDPRQSLAEAGLGAGDLWRRVAGLDR
jgi:hypothetical protein